MDRAAPSAQVADREVCSFVRRLQRVAATWPDQPALAGPQEVSYRALCQRAGRIGAALRGRGVGPGDVVGLHLTRGAEYVVALLGVWWAGAAFVPLEPRLPGERLAYMAHDAGVRLIVAGAASAEGVSADTLAAPGVLPGVPSVTLAALEQEAADRADRLDERRSASLRAIDGGPPVEAAPEDLAYVIYTSGTTGAPRGVEVPHRGLVNLLDAQIAAFELGPGSRSLLLLSISFDASLSDIGTALLSGATLVLEDDQRLSPAVLLRTLRERGITHLDVPPAVLRELDPDQAPASLRVLVVGGEPCPPEVIRRWARQRRVVNVYGPTEATICASLCACDAATWDRPLLGQPIPGVTFQVLQDSDGGLRGVPDGAPGELYLGGVGLSLGYRGAPELTARKFVQHDGQRLYRTGDRVVRRLDGEYEFLGRLDRQIKLRGLRIEPEEIEARLRQHAGVAEAAVVLAGEALWGYVVARPGDGGDDLLAALHGHLRAALPRWMLPRLVLVPELPRTPSGKPDLRALATAPPRLVPPHSIASAARPLPDSAGQAQVAELLGQALGVPQVSAADDFVSLGGDSLRALEVLAAAEAAGVALPADLLLGGATVAELAAHLGEPPESRRTSDLAADVRGLVPRAPTAPPVSLIDHRASRSPSEPAAHEILLTGAAGLLGSRVLVELLLQTDRPVTCLVRAPDAAQAAARVEAAVAGHGLGHHLLRQRPRVTCVPGDLAQPRLGLSAARWRDLCQRTSDVYHLAARVHLLLPYPALRPDNVLGTAHVLALCAAGPRKRLHYASTMSALLLRGDDTDDAPIHGGYAQSKWAAEHLCHLSASALAALGCYRLGLLVPGLAEPAESPAGPPESPATPQKSPADPPESPADPPESPADPARIHDLRDQLSLFLRGAARLGCLPAEAARLRLDLTPLGHAAATLVRLSLSAPHGVRPLTGRSVSLADLVESLRGHGVPIAWVPTADFRRAVQRGCGDPAVSAAYLSLSYRLGGPDHRGADLFLMTDVPDAPADAPVAPARRLPDLALYLSRLFPRGGS